MQKSFIYIYIFFFFLVLGIFILKLNAQDHGKAVYYQGTVNLIIIYCSVREI